jgi:hypothetical protein
MKARHVDHMRPVSPLVTAAGIGTLVFVLLPLPFIVLYSFSKSNYALFGSSAFTLEWFQRFFENERFMAALRNSLMVSVITTIAAVRPLRKGPGLRRLIASAARSGRCLAHGACRCMACTSRGQPAEQRRSARCDNGGTGC